MTLAGLASRVINVRLVSQRFTYLPAHNRPSCTSVDYSTEQYDWSREAEYAGTDPS